MIKSYQTLVLLSSALLLTNMAAATNEYTAKFDLDIDGIADEVMVSKPEQLQEDPDAVVPVNIKISYSSGAHSVNAKLDLDGYTASVFDVSLWRNIPGILVLNYAELSGREPADGYYEIYKWETRLRKMCLYESVIPAQGDKAVPHSGPRYISIRIYNPCIGIGDQKPDSTLEDKDYYQKFLIKTHISKNKVRLYNTPSQTDKSKMYLVKGDEVTISEYRVANGSGWFLVDYFPKQKREKITKWLPDEALDPEINY
jgi:hypothetical protein